jgi:hypothetical protein
VATVVKPNASSAIVQRTELVQLRSKYLKDDRVLGPAWVILLRLVSRTAFSRSREVCDLISIPNVPATTAQRCLDYLLAIGLVDLAIGPGKRFRKVQLSSQAIENLQVFLASIDDANVLELRYFAMMYSGEE